MSKIVILGGVAAGMSAASKAIRMDNNHKITVYTDERYISYSACCLPYFVKGIYEKDVILRTPDAFHKMGVDVQLDCRVTAMDPAAKTVTITTKEGRSFMDTYDKLIIATGARAIKPSLPGVNLPGIYQVKKIPDVNAIRSMLRANEVKKAVVVGGGFIGLEMTEALSSYGVEVTLLEFAPQLVAPLDPDMAAVIEAHLIEKGVSVHTNEGVTAFEGESEVRRVVTPKNTYPADMVILAIGVSPNSEFAARAGARTGAKNAILVNEYLETSLPDVYAAGDCATARHLVSGKDVFIPLGTTANKQGKVAGENAAGGHVAFPGIVGTTVFKVMDLEAGRTGLSTAEATAMGRPIWEVKASTETKATYYPGWGRCTMKLIMDKETNVIVGAQIVGNETAAKRIDLLVPCVQLGLTPADLAKFDISYAPPFCHPMDVAQAAANVALSQIQN